MAKTKKTQQKRTRSPRQLLGIFVAISFFLTVGTGVGLIGFTSENTISRLKQENTRTEMLNAANYLSEQVDHLTQTVNKVAQMPAVMNFAIGLEGDTTSVSDHVAYALTPDIVRYPRNLPAPEVETDAETPAEAPSNQPLTAEAHFEVMIIDAANEQLFGDPEHFTKPIQALSEQMLDDSDNTTRFLLNKQENDQSDLTVLMPIQYEGYTEAVLSLSFPFDEQKLFSTVLKGGNRWVALSQIGQGVFPTPNKPRNWQTYNYPLESVGLILHYGVNRAQVIAQRNALIKDITFVLVGGMALIFVLVYFLGEGIVLGPYRALLQSKKKIQAQTREIQKRVEENKSLAQVAEKAHDSIVICNPNGEITWVNPAFLEQTGYEFDEVIGKIPGHILQGEDTDPEAVETLREAVESHRSARVKILNYSKDQTPYWVDIDLAPIKNESGELERFIAIERDVTEMEQLLEENRQAVERAEMANKAKSQFLANMSHEIRTPMNGVLGLAQILMRDDVTENQLKHLHNLHNSGMHMMSILNDILDLSKVEAGKLTLDPTAFRFGDLIENLLSIYTSMATEKGLELKLENNIDENQAFFADQSRIRQILFNLIGNAIKFTEMGSITVAFRMLGDELDHRTLVMEVRDTGVGIPPERLKHIFDPFEQAEENTTRRFGGTGLGLSIIRHIVTLMGGHVNAESIVGKGSVFTVDLRAELADANDIEEKVVDLHEAFSASSFEDCRALVVDDIPLNTMIVSNFLKTRGFAIDTAENGKIALEKVRDNDYQIVIMDNHMPTMDGVEATTHIRNLSGARGETLVVACTADAFRETRTIMMEAGCDEVMVKPVDEKKFDNVLAQFEKRILAGATKDHSIPSLPDASAPETTKPKAKAAPKPASTDAETATATATEESTTPAKAKPAAKAKARPTAAKATAKASEKAMARPASAKAKARPAAKAKPAVEKPLPSDEAIQDNTEKKAPARTAAKAKARPAAKAAARPAAKAKAKPAAKPAARPAAKKAAPKPAAAKAKPAVKPKPEAAKPATPVVDKVINEEGLNEALGGDKDMITQVLKMFVDSNEGDINKLRNFLDEDNLAEAHRYAHSTKGTSAYLSADAFHKQCLNIEQAAKEGNKPDEMDIALFEAMLNKALEEAKALIAKYEG